MPPRLLPIALVVSIAAGTAFSQATNTRKLQPLDGNPTLFAVLAAVNAAGYDTDIDSPSNSPLRRQLREHLATRNIPSLPALRRFVRDHHLPDATADLGQYISFALLSKGAPDFTPAMPNFPAPADADRLHDFPPLLAQFYAEAEVAKLWELAQPFYEAALEQYTEPVALAVQGVNVYFRTPMNQQTRGRFQVFIDLLGAPNQAHARTYVDEYFVVATPSVEPRIDAIRHHYLRFWTDGLAFKFTPEINKLKPLGDYALASPALGEQFRKDFVLLATESFIDAVESRILREPARATQAMREGFVLAPAFAELLPVYEKQPDTMRNYFPEILKGVDPRKEAVRLDKIDFVKERAVRTVRVTGPAKPPALTGVAKTLDDAENAFRAQKYAEAKAAWSEVAATAIEKPAQARALYGLGRLALTDRNPERADQIFRKVLESEPDASTSSWTLLYLGKLADSQGEGNPAKEFYRRALGVTGVSEQVKREAEQGLTGSFFKARPPDADEPDDEEEDDEEDDL